MIEFKALAMKADIDELYAIFLLKENVQLSMIKTILGYLPIVVTTTYPMINDSTINKSQVRISCGKFTRELNKKPLLN